MAAKNTAPTMTYAELIEELGSVVTTMQKLGPVIPTALYPHKPLKSHRKTVQEWVEQVTVEMADMVHKIAESAQAFEVKPDEEAAAQADKPAEPAKPAPAKNGGKPAATNGGKPAAPRGRKSAAVAA